MHYVDYANELICIPRTFEYMESWGHGTLTTGKILRSGYLGNGCHGNEKMFLILKYSLDWPKNVPGRSIMDGSKIMV